MIYPIQKRLDLSRSMRTMATVGLFGMLAAVPIHADQQTADLNQKQLATFKTWQVNIKADLIENGLSESFAGRVLKTVKPDPVALRQVQRGTTKKTNTAAFMAAATSASRIAKGRDALTLPILARLEERYGISRSALLAIANSRDTNTEHNLIDALATLSALDQKRGPIWYREFVAALRLAEARAVPIATMRGSAIGTSGATHLTPTFFEAFAQEPPAKANRQQWHRTSDDAFTTTANALAQLGWRPVPADVSWWGYEVRLPANLDFSDVGLSYDHPGAKWQARGVTRDEPGLIPPTTRFSLIAPQGASGPAFLVTHNVRVLRRLHDDTSTAPNNTIHALAIARLAHRILGGAPLEVPWRTVKTLTRSERMQIQERLVARGYDTGGIDGILGRKSAVAIRAEQRKHGIPQDGFVDQAVMRLLQHNGLPHVGETQ